jgi:hypothetical protein
MQYSSLRLAGLILLASYSLSVNAAIIRDDTAASNGTITNDFQGLINGDKDSLVLQTGARYGEHFAGQTISPLLDVWDLVSAAPSGPLDVQVGTASENLTVALDTAGNKMLGGTVPDPELTVVPPENRQGAGAMSILLDKDTDVFSFDVIGFVGISGFQVWNVWVDLFARDGTLLFNENISATLEAALSPTGTNDSLSGHPLSDVRIGYRGTDGTLIAGATIYNEFGGQFTVEEGDFGIRIDDVSFNAVPVPAAGLSSHAQTQRAGV